MKKQSKLMTFLMSLLLAFMLAVPGNAVSTQAAGPVSYTHLRAHET